MILVALAVGAATVALGGSDGDATIGRDGSTLVDRAGEPLAIGDEPTTYRVVYRAQAPGEGELLTTTDELVVRRPFQSALRSHAGERLGGTARAVTTASFGRLQLAGGSRSDLVLAEPPGVSASDVRLGPVLDDALDRDLLEVRERREVLGRECQVYRSGDALGTGSISAPTADEYTDTCVDAAGLVLEEVLVVGGETLFRRVAVEVDESPDLSTSELTVEAEPVHVDQGGGSVLRMREGSRPPTEFWQLPEAPEGFEPCGRFNVVPPQPENTSDPMRAGLVRSAAVDVWVDGPDLVLVEQGGTRGGTHPFQLGDDRVDLGPLGSGDFVLSTHGSMVRALIAGGRYVQVQGTLPLEELVALARSLEPVEGGTLEVVDGPPELSC